MRRRLSAVLQNREEVKYMSLNVDARGLNCPQPVIATKKALDSIDAGLVTVIVDNAVAKENVTKFAVANHCSVATQEKDGHYYLTITKGSGASAALAAPLEEPAPDGTVYLITSETLGHGSAELGAVLMKSFFFTLTSADQPPKALLFLNSGVKLAVAGSPVLDHLQTLANKKVEILSCGTCLDYFALKEQLAVGGITNMYTILEMVNGSKSITL